MAFLTIAERVLDDFSLREVALDFGKADEAAGLIAERGEDLICPVARAIFADAPTFGFEAAFELGGSQLGQWLANSLVFGGVTDGEMLADDFVGAVALDAGGADVPGGD